MKKMLITILLVLMFSVIGHSQATFIIDSIPDYTPPEDTIYVAGDFNEWNPGQPEFALQKNAENKWFITTIAQPDGTIYQYKFTRGSWETVEKGPMGEEIPNRQFTFGNGDTVHIIIYNWRDYGGSGSTAAENVTVMDENFYMPQLNRNRRIWLYFPPDYDTSGESYPVLYMHDGQNLFDAFTSYAGEWQVDETLNTLSDQGYKVPLVVGIDNGGLDRIDEYTPWSNPEYGGGDGDLYMEFIAETLKPYIDGHYRTLSDRNNTGIMGSSLGGLISHYGTLNYQNIFSKAGFFSPSYWFSDSVWAFTHLMGKQDDFRLYQMCGSLEGGTMVIDMERMQDSLFSIGFTQDDLFTKVVDGGQHNESLWRQEFGQAYLWLFTSWANTIDDEEMIHTIRCTPNPSNDVIYISRTDHRPFENIVIYDIRGIKVKTLANVKGNSISISDLSQGTYFIRCNTKESYYTGKFIKR
jgi:predicted alpha/beta superfamily hydrolase